MGRSTRIVTAVVLTGLVSWGGLVVAGPAFADDPGGSVPSATTPEPSVTTPEPTVTTPSPTETTPSPTPTPSATTPSPTPTPPKPKPARVSKSYVLGKTVTGRKIMAHYRGWKNIRTKRVLVVLGQMHGNEKGGLHTIAWLRQHAKPTLGNALWIVPTMNPDGNARGTRRNARGVDLNRNWPTSGWTGKNRGSGTWGGPSRASERETRIIKSFLAKHKPDYIASLHQPFGVVVKNGRYRPFERRLARGLNMPLRTVGVGTPSNKVSPTLTGWYNRYYKRYGTATTIEYRAKVTASWARGRAAKAILNAALIR